MLTTMKNVNKLSLLNGYYLLHKYVNKRILSLVAIGSIRELNWRKFVVEQLKKSACAYGRGVIVRQSAFFYLVVSTFTSLFLLAETR